MKMYVLVLVFCMKGSSWFQKSVWCTREPFALTVFWGLETAPDRLVEVSDSGISNFRTSDRFSSAAQEIPISNAQMQNCSCCSNVSRSLGAAQVNEVLCILISTNGTYFQRIEHLDSKLVGLMFLQGTAF